MYKIIWEYMIKPEKQKKFAELYGPDGGWVKLFRLSEHYKGTELLKKSGDNNIYLTIDTWSSQRDYELFINKHAEEYNAIDNIGDGLTGSENKLGTYMVI